MRLVDLRPKWVLPCMNWSGDEPYHIGIAFNCPVCGKRLAVRFRPAIDKHGLKERWGWPNDMVGDGIAWQRTGDTFDTLTLQPSINFMPHDWHGDITNGELTTSQHP